jgi:hypothetical protein
MKRKCSKFVIQSKPNSSKSNQNRQNHQTQILTVLLNSHSQTKRRSTTFIKEHSITRNSWHSLRKRIILQYSRWTQMCLRLQGCWIQVWAYSACLHAIRLGIKGINWWLAVDCSRLHLVLYGLDYCSFNWIIWALHICHSCSW